MTQENGDPDLAARLRGALGRRHPFAAVATLSDAQVRVASLGVELGSDFEIGSISKGLTGLLYAEALTLGEIDVSTTLGSLLPLADTPAAQVSLASISTHRSGLPRLPTNDAGLRKTIDLWRHGTNPYGEDLDALMEQARRTKVGRPKPFYSNVGFELLGHALAHAAATSYPDLVEKRLAQRLRIATLYAPATPEDLRSTALSGRSKRGKPQDPWTGAALAPAGGLRASITDMARLAEALLDGTAPGIAALTPVARFGRGAEIGAAWITLTHLGRQITWHNGGTGGFRSWIGLDLQAQTAVVLLSATSASIDPQGFRMLAELTTT